MLSIDMQFMFGEEKLQFFTWCPSGLTPRWQIWWSLSVCKTGSGMPFSLSWFCLVHTSYRFMNEKVKLRELLTEIRW